MVPDPMARYKQLLFFASKLEGLDDALKIEENKVQVIESNTCLSSTSNVSSACTSTIQPRALAGLCQSGVGDSGAAEW
jgi:sulfur transfer protein SufE